MLWDSKIASPRAFAIPQQTIKFVSNHLATNPQVNSTFGNGEICRPFLKVALKASTVEPSKGLGFFRGIQKLILRFKF